MEICKLCGKPEILTQHHIIPKFVIEKVNPKSELRKELIYLCEKCHEEVHLSLLNHIIMYGKRRNNFNSYNAMKYVLLKEFLLSKYKNVDKAWKEYFNKFINQSVKEFDEDNEDE